MRQRAWCLAVVAVLAIGTVQAADKVDAKAVAAKIDRLLAEQWKKQQLKPAEPVEDATFLRRVYLDLSGRIPPITAVRDFLDDPDPDKRAKLVEKLLAGDDHVRHQATLWRKAIVPDAAMGTPTGVETWLQQQFRTDAGFDVIARNLLMARGAGGVNDGPTAFYQANEYKPENLAAATTRLFLGVRLECAQCHDHPFAPYTRDQFWQFAAFFSTVSRPGQPGGQPGGKRGEITIPNTDRVVKARALRETDDAVLPDDRDPREVLSAWLLKKDNRYFAPAMVNRAWSHFFGNALVEPVDDMTGDNKSAVPEVLDELARSFAASGHDPKFLARVITATRAYQLGSQTAEGGSAEDYRFFARMPVRGLTPEQLYDSLILVRGDSGRSTRQPGADFGTRNGFLARFASQDRSPEAQTSILQALYLMNGTLTTEVSSPEKNRHLRTLADARNRTAAQRIEELYLLVLSRKPTADESSRLSRYVEEGGPHRDGAKALGDVLWALLNGPEFCLNH